MINYICKSRTNQPRAIIAENGPVQSHICPLLRRPSAPFYLLPSILALAVFYKQVGESFSSVSALGFCAAPQRVPLRKDPAQVLHAAMNYTPYTCDPCIIRRTAPGVRFHVMPSHDRGRHHIALDGSSEYRAAKKGQAAMA